MFDMTEAALPLYQADIDNCKHCDVCKDKGKEIQTAVVHCGECKQLYCEEHLQVLLYL